MLGIWALISASMAAGWRREYGDKSLSHTGGCRLKSKSDGGAGQVGGYTGARLAVCYLVPVYWRSGTVFLCSIFVPQQIVQRSGQFDEETQSGVAVNSGRNGGGQSEQIEQQCTKRQRTISRRVFSTSCGPAQPVWGTLLLHMGRFAPGFPATHILCRVSVFPLNITDRTVTSSRL